MSLARRQYNTKDGSQIVDSVPIDTSCDWDEKAIQRAIREAHEIEGWDRDAANQLLAQAQAAKARLDGKVSTEPLDLMRLYARVLRNYNGGIRDVDFARMDYRRFFGYVRELDLMLEEEAEAAKGPSRNESDVRAALGSLPHAEEYEGEVIKLI